MTATYRIIILQADDTAMGRLGYLAVLLCCAVIVVAASVITILSIVSIVRKLRGRSVLRWSTLIVPAVLSAGVLLIFLWLSVKLMFQEPIRSVRFSNGTVVLERRWHWQDIKIGRNAIQFISIREKRARWRRYKIIDLRSPAHEYAIDPGESGHDAAIIATYKELQRPN
jgi:hypothetical protein